MRARPLTVPYPPESVCRTHSGTRTRSNGSVTSKRTPPQRHLPWTSWRRRRGVHRASTVTLGILGTCRSESRSPAPPARPGPCAPAETARAWRVSTSSSSTKCPSITHGLSYACAPVPRSREGVSGSRNPPGVGGNQGRRPRARARRTCAASCSYRASRFSTKPNARSSHSIAPAAVLVAENRTFAEARA